MENISDLKDLPGDVTTTVNTQALLSWLRFGITDPPIPVDAPLLILRRKQGRHKAPQRPPFPVAPPSLARPEASHPDGE